MDHKTSTVSIQLPSQLLAEIDTLAAAESRSRSEVIRSAASMYVQCRERWEAVFGEAAAVLGENAFAESKAEREIG
jgi:metal-responsive CopG/Arc/MetJ family transcriptional regulator